MDVKPPKNTSEFLNRLTDFLTDFPERTKEELWEDLLAKGINPEETIQHIQETIKSKIEEHRLAWLKQAKQERLRILEKLEKVRPSRISGDFGKIEELKDRVIKILSGQFGHEALAELHIHFHNLESITEDDLISLLDDIKDIEILDKSVDTDRDDSDG